MTDVLKLNQTSQKRDCCLVERDILFFCHDFASIYFLHTAKWI